MSNELVTADFQQLDRLDEEQILAEMQGAVLDTYVYSFKSGGRQVTGLSWAGVKAVAAKMGSVQVDLLQLTPGEGGWTCVVKATAPDGSSRIGAAEQPYEMDTKRGPQPDPFALPKCVSKAQRNAIRALLPESLITEMVRMYQAQQAPRRTQQPARKAPSKPQPANGKPANSEPKTVQDWIREYEVLAQDAAKYGINAPAIPNGADIAAVRVLGHELKQQWLARKRAVEGDNEPV